MQKIVTLLLLLTSTFSLKASTKDQHNKVLLRTISHEFLLQINDSTSRILPIKNNDGKYIIQFENEFSFEPDQLLYSVFKVLEKTSIKKDFIIEIEDCITKEIVHSSQTNANKNLAPCRQRALPKGCYNFFFTIITPPAITKKTESTSSYFIVIITLVIGVTIFLFLKKKNNKKQNLIPIGEYLLDHNRMLLIYKNEPFELSSKEADLLFYFNSKINQTLDREQILNIIWDDNGNYIGRTLDVYVSKLRKKLQLDARIKIVNIRGIGYKFIIND